MNVLRSKPFWSSDLPTAELFFWQHTFVKCFIQHAYLSIKIHISHRHRHLIFFIYAKRYSNFPVEQTVSGYRKFSRNPWEFMICQFLEFSGSPFFENSVTDLNFPPISRLMTDNLKRRSKNASTRNIWKLLISCFARSWKPTMIRYDVQFYGCLLAREISFSFQIVDLYFPWTSR